MLKLISTSSARHFRSRFSSFCSGSSSYGEEAQVKSAAESNATSLTALVFPFLHRPLFPGFHKQLYIEDLVLLAALQDIKLHGRKDVCCGTFLVKDDHVKDPNMSICPVCGELYGPTGKDTFPHLHKVGTLAKIIDLSDLEHPAILSIRRVRITEMVSGYPFVVKVEVLEDNNALKATATEVMSTLADVMKITNLRIHHPTTMNKHTGEFNYSRMAEFGAAMSGASKSMCQKVLEKLDVHKRLNLTLELLKKDLKISKLQESVGKAAEEKIRRERKK